MFKFEIGAIYHGFELIKRENLEEIRNIGYLFKHKKSGAELLALANDDENKTFCIAFRTPPNDSTGVPHILEHSVLNGSRKYSIKDPFAEMIKTSLASFINAFTFADKTAYPVASKNEKDFLNLMDLYLDAVFYPLLTKETFYQEGWHYELENKESPITYKGVVYNEMKGAYSEPDSIVDNLKNKALFPDTIYRYEAGGYPENIVDLTYEDFVNFHKKYYHPSNSRIILYGDLDFEKYLKFIDENYLSNFDAIDVSHSKIESQVKFNEKKIMKGFYPISENESLEQKTIVALSYLLDEVSDPEFDLGFSILSTIIVGLDNSPLKKALLESNLGHDIYGRGFIDYGKQGVFDIGLKGTDEEHVEKIEEIINNTLKNLVENGIDEKLIEASINKVEFILREANFGSFPKGIIYFISALKGWLYDKCPFDGLKFETDLKNIKEKVKDRYFEKLIEKYLLNNNHRALIIVKPDKEIARIEEEKVAKKLEEIKKSLSEDELNYIIEETKKLQELQSKPNSKEDLDKLPKLFISDVEKKADKYPTEEFDFNGTKLLFHDLFTNGVAYLDVAFNISDLPLEYYPYLTLFFTAYKYLGTKDKSPEEFEQEILINTGDIYLDLINLVHTKTRNTLSYLKISGKAVTDKFGKLLDLISEMINDTNLDNISKLKQIIMRSKMKMKQIILTSGHFLASTRISSYFNKIGKISEYTNGVTYYKFLEDISKKIETNPEEIVTILKNIKNFVFNKEKLIINLTTDKDSFNKFSNTINPFLDKIPNNKITLDNNLELNYEITPNEGLMIPSQVQYVGFGGNLYELGMNYSGDIHVLKNSIDIDYMWQNVRLKGGAYGGYSMFNELSGNFYLLSYRDPNLKETLDIYKNIVNFIENISFSQEEIEKLIIGALQKFDKPLTPDKKGYEEFINYLVGKTQDDKQRIRDEVLSADLNSLKKYKDVFAEFIKNGKYCVIGNENKLKENENLFSKLINVFEN